MKDINLLPEEERPVVQAPTERKKIDFKVDIKSKTIAIGVAIAVIAIGVLAAPKIYIKIQNVRLENLQKSLTSSKYAEVNAVTAETASVSAALASKLNVLNTIDKQTYSLNEVMQSLKRALPSGVAITNLTYDSSTLNISIKAQNPDKIAELLLNLNRLTFITLQTGDSLAINKDGVTSLSLKLGKGGAN